MKFLLDAQLPTSFARTLSNAGYISQHLAAVGLLSAADSAVWAFAREAGCALITKDEDFARRWSAGDRSVQVVWLRIGNCSRQALAEWFMPQLPAIIGLLAAGETLIEVR